MLSKLLLNCESPFNKFYEDKVEINKTLLFHTEKLEKNETLLIKKM